MSSNYKRRFNDEQIKSLEFMFESESRPESQMKHQLANELGLEPRQVAVWFQNRRARSKTKQIEHDYKKLKASFDSLASSYESLKRENQTLLVQIKELKDTLEKHQDGSISSSDDKSGNGGTAIESKEEKHSILSECYEHKLDVPLSNERCKNDESTEKDIAVMNMEEELTESSGNWCFLEEPSTTSQWWEFWS